MTYARADTSAAEFTEDELRAIEVAAVEAWPAFEIHDISGWLWRYSGGGSQRANSVSTLEFRGADPEAAIAEAEARYFSRNAPSRFQVSSTLAAPADLDQRLARRGYRIHEPVSTLAMRLSVNEDIPTGVVVADRPSDGWMEVYLSNVRPDRHAAAPRILASVPTPKAFLSFEIGGQTLSTALAVLRGNILIAECIGTRAEARRKGAARTVMVAVAAWGWQHGAKIVALQAVTENFPAQRLYAAVGFREVGRYHYRLRER